MTVLTTNVEKLDARAIARTSGFRVELMRDWKQALARWSDTSLPTPFQHPQWMAAWYEACRFTLEKTVRKELERSWRVFTRDPLAGSEIITDNDKALRILSTTEVQQGTRMQSLGLNFILNDETCAAFYRNLVRDGVGC